MERVGLFQTRAFLTFLGLAHCCVAPAGSTIEEYLHGQLLNNVVSITVSVPNAVARTGMGFVIGRQGDTVWVATAKHVTDVPRGLAPRISVHRKSDHTEWMASGAPVPASHGDIAFVPVEMPLHEAIADAWLQSAIAAEPQPGEQVWIAGMVAEINYDDGNARVAGVSVDGIQRIDGLRADQGQSGSPVVVERGIIGMLAQRDGAGTVIPIEQIRVQAARASLPWVLTDSGVPPPIPARVCIHVSGLEDPGPIGLNMATGISRLDSAGCADVRAGAGRLVVYQPFVSCQPTEFTLSRQPSQSLAVMCGVDPEGIWQSAVAGYLQVMPGGENEWQVFGLDGLSFHGVFRGRMMGMPPAMFIDMQADDNTRLQGPFEVAPRSLRGRVILDGRPTTIEFLR